MTSQPHELKFPKSLSQTDRQLLAETLFEPLDAMDDPSFEEPGVERMLFDESRDVEPARVDWYQWLHMDPETRAQAQAQATATPLLKPEQERTLFLRFNYCRKRAEAARQAINPKRLGVRKCREFLKWYRRAMEIRSRIAEYNLALVLAMTRRLPAHAVDMPEMIGEGNLALLRAIDKFRVDRGFKFSTYACRAILKAFSRYGEKHTRYRRMFPVEFEPDYERSNFAAEKALNEEQDCASEVRRIFESNAAQLSALEHEIIGHRFFYDEAKSDRRPTLQEVGRMVGLTKERVRQIQNKAMDRLRVTLEAEFLDGRGSIEDVLGAREDGSALALGSGGGSDDALDHARSLESEAETSAA